MKGQTIIIFGLIATALIWVSIYYLYVNRAGDETATLLGKLILGIIGIIGLTFFGLFKHFEPTTYKIENIKILISEETGEVAPYGSYFTGLNPISPDIFTCLTFFKTAQNNKQLKNTYLNQSSKNDIIETLFLIWYSQTHNLIWDKKRVMDENMNGMSMGIVGRKKGYECTDVTLTDYNKELSDKYGLDSPLFNALTFPPGTKTSRIDEDENRIIKIETDKAFFKPRLVITITFKQKTENTLQVKQDNPYNRMLLLLPLLTSTENLSEWKELVYTCEIKIEKNRFALDSPEIKKQVSWVKNMYEELNNNFAWAEIKDKLMTETEAFYDKNKLNVTSQPNKK